MMQCVNKSLFSFASRDGRGCWQPDGMSLTGGSGAARFRGHVKSLYSAGEKVRVTEGPRV